MTETDRQAFVRLLTILAETFGEQVSAGRLEGYWLALEDVPLADFQRAVEAATRACKFFPRPVELRELAGETPPDAGHIEALLVEHLCQPNGERRTPTDPFLALVAERLGGIYQAAGMDSSDRIAKLRTILPGITSACRQSGIPVPVNVPSAHVLGLLSRVGQPPLEVTDQRPVRALPARVRALTSTVAKGAS